MKAYVIYKHLLRKDGTGFVVGGIETYLLSLSQILKELSIDVIIVQCSQFDFEKSIEGIRFLGFSNIKESRFHKDLYKKIKEELKEEDLLIWGTDTFSIRTQHKRTLAIQHGIDFDYYPIENKNRKIMLAVGLGHLFKYLQRRRALKVFSRASYKVCVDYNFWNWYRTFSTPNEEKNIFVIPNFSHILKCEKKQHEDNIVKIVFARRFVRRRGILPFINVVRKILKNGVNASFTFAGEGPYNDEIKKLCDEFSNVHLTKYNPIDSLEFHSNFDIAVVPTIGSEGTSFSLLEAMAAGNAVVCTEVGGMTNIILNDFNGIMIKPDSEVELENALLKLISDKKERMRLSNNAIKTIEESFSFDLWKKRWIKVINNIIE